MKKNSVMKFSLLSISFVLTSSMSISATIPLMKKTFSNAPLSTIEMVTTIPSLMVTLFVLLSIPISKRIGSKQTVVIGLIISLLSGIVPVFIENLTIIMISRAGLGIGLGLFNSLAISLINDFFEGEERIQLIGFQSAFQGLGGAILTYVSGQLMKLNWHLSYSVYFIIIPILILVILFLPNPPKKIEKNKEKKIFYFQKEVLQYLLLMLLIIVIYNAIYIKIPTLITEKRLGSAVDSSIILTIIQIGSMLTGFTFGTIHRLIKKYILPLALIIIAIAYIILSFAESIIFIGVASLASGVAFSLFAPYLFNIVAIVSSPENRIVSTSLLILGAQIGSFISPYMLVIFSKVPILTSEVSQVYLTGAIILVPLSSYLIIKNIKQK